VQLWLYHSVALGKVYLQVLQRNLSNTCTNPSHKYMRLQRKTHKRALKITIVQQLHLFKQNQNENDKNRYDHNLMRLTHKVSDHHHQNEWQLLPVIHPKSQQSYDSILKISDTDAKICIPSFQNQQGNSVMMVASTQEKQLIKNVNNTLIQAVASL
jgi:hypothetical protein